MRTLGILAVLATVASLALSLLLAPAPAGASVRTVGSTTVGLQSREASRYWAGYWKFDGYEDPAEANPQAIGFDNNPGNPSQPGPVVHSLATYAVYWDPSDFYHGDWQGLIDGFLANLGTAGGRLDNVFAVDAQYTDRTDQPATSHSSFHGAYTDTNPYPASEGCTDPHPWTLGVPMLQSDVPVCLTDAQVRTQLATFINEQHGIQKGMGTIVYLLTPPGVTVCLDEGGPEGHCSDFKGTIGEISTYEEAKHRYVEERKAYLENREKYEKERQKYEEEKVEKEEKGEPDEAEPPVAPVAPVEPTAPASYADYTKSFCSYHSDVSPTNPENGDGNTLLYAVIPWTAGGDGDYNFAAADRTPAYDCQDGGFQPNSKPLGELLEKEHSKPRTPKEEEEFRQKSAAEQREEEEARELGLENPHEQEPNQLGAVRAPDGNWDEGLADVIANQIAVEQQDIVTDPLLNAWHDPAGSEVTDECRNSFFPSPGGSASANPYTRAGTLSNQLLAGHAYYLNDAFNLAAQRLPYPGVPCMNNVALEPKFTAPNAVNSGEIVGFDGMESNITLDAAIAFSPTGVARPNYATYTWDFGDGSPVVSGYAPGAPSANSPQASPCAVPWEAPCAASAFHSYQYGGAYDVTLTVTDVGGNTGSVTHQVTVDGPPRPTGNPGGGGSPGGGGVTTAAPTTPLAPPAPAPVPSPTPAPVLGASVQSLSLKKALNSGLAVRYTANEQVAGSIQVLLDAATAKRLGVHGPAATGLPAGTPRSIVVGTALLVTTKAGQGTIRIKFSHRTAARLKRTHNLKLTLRLFARNASRQSPQTTTLLSTVVLKP
jgi:PKD domain-containing protein